MITLWRYLISSYLKVFALSIAAFITLLLISRLQELAHFMTLGATFSTILLFIAYQIPYLLPIATAIASLLAAFLLFHRLSATQELTTLRSSGLSLSLIATPLLLLAALISFANFYLHSECATTSHLKTREMVSELTSQDPLLLLSHARLPKLKTSYIHLEETAPTIYKGEVAFYHKNSARIHYLIANQMTMREGHLIAHDLTLIGSLPAHQALFIENQRETIGSVTEWLELLRPKKLRIANDYLTLKLLRLQKREWKKQKTLSSNPKEKIDLQKKIEKCDSELICRISLTCAPFTFTLMGIGLGMHIGRNQSRRNLLISSLLALITLLSFFAGKEFSSYFYWATLLFLGPHLIMILLSMRAFYKINRGIS